MGFAGSSNLPLFIAQEQGFFAKESVFVSLSAAPNSATQMASLVDGRIDIAMTAMDNVVANAEGGVFAFLGVSSGARFNLIVSPAVKSYSDLRGRTLAVDSLTTGYTYVLMDMLRRGGISPNEYTLVAVGGSRDRLAALRSGKAMGALLNAPQDAAAEAAGFTRLGNAEAIGPYQGSVGAARRAWASANAAALVGYIRAYIAATDWLFEPSNRTEAVKLLQQRLNISEESAVRSYQEISLSPKAAIDLAGVQTVLDLRRQYARPQKPLGDAGRYYDSLYYERALRND